MNCTEKMKGHKIVHVFRYHVTNKHKFPGKYAHHLLTAHFFNQFCSESELLQVNKTYQEQLRDKHNLSVFNTDRFRFEPFADLVDETCKNWNAEQVFNQDVKRQNENFETNGGLYDEHVTYLKNKDNKYREHSFNNFMPEILTNDEIAAHIKSLNKKRRGVSNIVHKWAKDYL